MFLNFYKKFRTLTLFLEKTLIINRSKNITYVLRVCRNCPQIVLTLFTAAAQVTKGQNSAGLYEMRSQISSVF